MLPRKQNPTGSSSARVSPEEVGPPTTAQASDLESPESKAEGEQRAEKEFLEMIAAACGDVDDLEQSQMLPEQQNPTATASSSAGVLVLASPQFGAPSEDVSTEFSEEELREMLASSEAVVDWRRHACYDPDHLHRKLQAQLKYNELERSGALSEQKPLKPVRTAREVAEEKYRKEQEREEEERRRGLGEHPDDNVKQATTTTTTSTTAARDLDYVDYVDLVKEFNEIPGTLTPYEEKVITHDAVFVNPATVHISTDSHWNNFITEVFVDSATSPAEFFVHKQKNKMALEVLEDAMFEFYQPFWKVSRILRDEELIMTGIYAVYSFEHNRWFRGKLCYMNPGYTQHTKIGVFLIDHGIRVEVTCECIFPLKVSYTELPGQAARASLNVVPNIQNMQWSDDETQQFKADVEKKRFHAMVKTVGFDEYRHMTIVKLILLETINGEQRPYTFGGRLIPTLCAAAGGRMDNP